MVLGFACLRNEAQRLPHFLNHHRALGVQHFLIVDNDSDDDSAAFLADCPDVSLWRTGASYRRARFGMDWINWLLTRYGHGHWCLTVDADELLVYPGARDHDLPVLTRLLDRQGRTAFGALMLDLYPRGRLAAGDPPEDPLRVLRWFDAAPYRVRRQAMGNLWVQGGARARVFFADAPRKAPTLNKLPLVRWRRGMVYVNSTHAMLPRALNLAYDGPGGRMPSGALLHSKFLPGFVARSAEEQLRAQHFNNPEAYAAYYAAIAEAPSLFHAGATRYRAAEQLERLGLCTQIDWSGILPPGDPAEAPDD